MLFKSESILTNVYTSLFDMKDTEREICG